MSEILRKKKFFHSTNKNEVETSGSNKISSFLKSLGDYVRVLPYRSRKRKAVVVGMGWNTKEVDLCTRLFWKPSPRYRGEESRTTQDVDETDSVVRLHYDTDKRPGPESL